MKYVLMMTMVFVSACASSPQQYVRPERPKMLQCKILCQGGDTYSFNEADLNCQCKRPVKNTYLTYIDGKQVTEGVVLPLDNGRFITSKVKK